MRVTAQVILAQLEAAVPILRRLNEARFVNMKMAYAVTKNIQALDIELKALAEARTKLLKEYAELTGEGKFQPDPERPDSVKLVTEKSEEFWKKTTELLSILIDVHIWTVSLDSLSGLVDQDNKSIRFSPKELALIDFMIDAPEELEPEAKKPGPLAPVPPGENN